MQHRFNLSKSVAIAALAISGFAVFAQQQSNTAARGTRSILDGRHEIVKDAEQAKCLPQLTAAAQSELIHSPAAYPLYNRIFATIDGLGTPERAFDLLVVEPHRNLKMAATRADFDRAWSKLTGTLATSQGTNANSSQWRDFESLAFRYHRCIVRSWFNLDPIAEREQIEAQERASSAAKVVAAKDATASLGEMAFKYACNLKDFGMPRDFDSAQKRFKFGKSGAGVMDGKGRRFNAEAILRQFKWEKSGDRVFVLGKVMHEMPGQERVVLDVRQALRAGQVEVRISPLNENGQVEGGARENLLCLSE